MAFRREATTQLMERRPAVTRMQQLKVTSSMTGCRHPISCKHSLGHLLANLSVTTRRCWVGSTHRNDSRTD